MVRLLVAVCILALALPLTAGQAPNGVEYRLEIVCPTDRGVYLNNPYGTCPIFAVDPQDAMGDPTLAVDPDNPSNMIIASLHGRGGEGGPSERSRAGQAFTTFTTTDHGASWWDNPFFPPSNVSNAFGEHPALTIDPYGHVFVGSLYANPRSGGFQPGPEDRYDYVIAAQKFDDLGDINQNQDGEHALEFVGTVYPGNAITQMWFEYNRITDNMTMVWHEKVTPFSNGTASGGEGRIGDTLEEVLAHGSTDTLAAAAQQETPARSVIGVVWTRADNVTGYLYQPRSDAIGPCSQSTNPVIREDWLYIGCKVAANQGPFRWNPDAEPGRIEMFRMDPDGGTPQYLGQSPLLGGDPKLGVRSDGRIALMTSEVQDDRFRLDAVFGQYDPETGLVEWSGVKRYGDNMEALPASMTLVDANIQDLIYREYSGVLHLILKREVDYASTDAVALAAKYPSYLKSIVAIDEKHGLLAEIDLEIGDLGRRLQDMSLYEMPEETFNDIADDFLELPGAPHKFKGRNLGDTYQREFFAVGDYGIVQFAEMVEITELRGPGAPPLPSPPPPPIPAPAPAQVVAAAGAFTISTVMAASIAAAKRKAVVKDGGRKKRY